MTGWNLPPGCSVHDLPGYDDPQCSSCGVVLSDEDLQLEGPLLCSACRTEIAEEDKWENDNDR